MKEKYNVLIIGSVSDSKPLLDYYRNNDGVDYAICDLFEKNSDMLDYHTFDICNIRDMDYDCVVITVKSSQSVKNILMEEYNVDGSKILEFWKMYNAYVPLMVCDRIMLNPKHRSYDGIICGLSHTEVGVLPDRLNGRFANLSVSSQDIYYQYQTIKYCWETYPNKLKDLKYAVIETHDYHYFNFDTTLGHASYEYLRWGGFNKDKHNFDRNKSYDFTFDQALQHIINNKYANITENEIHLWEAYCKDVFAYNDFKGFEGNFNVNDRTTIVTDEHINNYLYHRAMVAKVFPETIKENTNILKKLFDLLLSINPDIKIYTVIIPKYIETEERDYELLKQHIPIFEKIMDMLHKEYQFTHLDFKKISDISQHRNFYYDAGHLNIFGANELTKMLNNIIFNN